MKIGLVASLAKPGGNVTGVVSLNKILVPKQLEMLRELVPQFVAAGGLISYGNSRADAYRLEGNYTGRILNR